MQTADIMDFHINLKVNFRGNYKNFLLSGSETRSWEAMEAMVRRHQPTHGAVRLLACFAFESLQMD